MQSEGGKKWCPQCERSHPATSEYFYAKDSTKTGLSCYCKVCSLRLTKEYADGMMAGAEQRRADLAASGEPKLCTKCGKGYYNHKEAFYQNDRTRTGYDAWCKDCIKLKNKTIHTSGGTPTTLDPSAVLAAITQNGNRPIIYNHTPSVECDFVCQVCGIGVGECGRKFASQAEADLCCEGVPPAPPPSQAKTFDRIPNIRAHIRDKYNSWINSSKLAVPPSRQFRAATHPVYIK